jgi:uncharacterized RDD family membrane protein YckC
MEDTLDTIDNYGPNEMEFKLAENGKRFANYLIDFVAYLIFSMVIGVIFGLVLVLMGNESYLIVEEEVTFSTKIKDWMFGIAVMTIYYTAMEYFFKGKTIGKLITGTRAVTLTNERMDLQTTFIRTICRFIPFEAFSFFRDQPGGWHDSLSKTKVIIDEGWHEISEDQYI